MVAPSTTPRLSFHGDPALRARVLAGLAEHRRLDQIRQGAFDDGAGGGCAVGCLCADFGLGRRDHSGLAAALGVN